MPLRILSLLVLATATAAAPPALDAETNTPYKWRVVVSVAPHPSLGPEVKRQFFKELKAALGPALGDDLGSVEVVPLADTPKEKWEPLWKKFDEKGWAALDADPVKEFNALTGVKTHFLTLKVVDGKFALECRQHDGSTGLATPLVRSRTVTDADTLSRTAGLMLAADFGPVGTVELLPDDKENCLLKMRGGELPGAARWVKAGDVFQFVVVQDVPRPAAADDKPKAAKPGQVLVAPTERKAYPQAYTLLRVTDVPQAGVARCEIYTKYETAFVRGRYVVGYRAMKVSTRDGRVSVRVEDDKGKPPAASAPLQVWATEFSPKVEPNDRDLLDRRGDVFSSAKALRGIAVVTVKLGSGVHQKYPLPVYDHGGATKLVFGFDETAVRKARFEDTAFRFYNRVLDVRMTREELTKAMRVMIDKEEYKAALDRAKAGLRNLTDEDERLSKELGELRKNPDAADAGPTTTLVRAERLLAGLRAANPDLEEKIKDLEVALAKAEDPTTYGKKFRANEITRDIAFHERRGEVPQALDKYDELIALTNLDEARGRKKKLEDEGKPRSDEQAGLRNYLTDTWAKLTTREEFDAAMPAMKQKVEALGRLDDKYGTRLAVTHVEGAYVRLGDLLTGLDSDFTEDKEKLLLVKRTMDALKVIEEIARGEQKRLEK